MIHSGKTVQDNKKSIVPKRLLIIASVFTIIMAVPHFFVPFIFPWEQLTGAVYPPVKWALFAMNFFFSLLLLWGGILSLVAAIKRDISRIMQYFIFGGIALFWAMGAVYEIIFPFPIAEARWVLPGIATSIFCLYGIALIVMSKAK